MESVRVFSSAKDHEWKSCFHDCKIKLKHDPFCARKITFIYACTYVYILINSILRILTRYRCKLQANRIANGTIRATIKIQREILSLPTKDPLPSSRLILYTKIHLG